MLEYRGSFHQYDRHFILASKVPFRCGVFESSNKEGTFDRVEFARTTITLAVSLFEFASRQTWHAGSSAQIRILPSFLLPIQEYDLYGDRSPRKCVLTPLLSR